MIERSVVTAIRRGTGAYLKIAGFRSHFVQTSVGRLHVLDARGRGEGPPVVLFHGLGSRSTDYLPMIRGLRSSNRRVLAPDMPGHGYSWNPGPETGSRPVRISMLEGLDALLKEPAVLFGNSLGGLVAIRYALERPEKVLGLMLANPGGAPISDEELAALLGQFRFRDRRDAQALIDALLVRPTRLKGVLAWGVERRMRRSGTRRLIERIDRTDLLEPEELAGLEAPIFFFWGREDRILPDSNRRFFLEHLPAHARIEQPPRYGHAPFLDDPGAFLDTLRGFAASVAR